MDGAGGCHGWSREWGVPWTEPGVGGCHGPSRGGPWTEPGRSAHLEKGCAHIPNTWGELGGNPVTGTTPHMKPVLEGSLSRRSSSSAPFNVLAVCPLSGTAEPGLSIPLACAPRTHVSLFALSCVISLVLAPPFLCRYAYKPGPPQAFHPVPPVQTFCPHQ